MNPKRWLILIFILAALVRLAMTWGPEFWYDEAFTALITRLPVSQMIVATAGDTHPPLYYLLVMPFSLLGKAMPADQEIILRYPSVLCSLAGLYAFWLILNKLRMITSQARWLALCIMAFSPWQLYFAQEARMYSLLQLELLLAVLAILDNKPAWLAGANLAMLYTHNYGVFYVFLTTVADLAINRLAILAGGQPAIRRRLAAYALPVALWLPWLAVVLYQVSIIQTGYWIQPVTAGQVIYTLTLILFGPFTRQFVVVCVLITTGLLAWCALRWIDYWRMDVAGPIYLAPWFGLAPFVLAISASLVTPIYLWRGFVPASPFIYLLVGIPLARLLDVRWKRLYLLALVGPAALAALAGYGLDITGFKSTTLESVDAVYREYWPGDIVYSTSDGTWVTWSTYWPDPVYLMPNCADDHDRGALSETTRQGLGIPQLPLDQIPHRRTWLLVNMGAQTSACNIARARELIGDAKPWKIIQADPFVFSAIYLLNK